MRKLTLIFLFFTSLSVFTLHSQIVVQGTVRAEGELLPGVSVVVKGGTEGTATDKDGRFQFTVNEASFPFTLQASFLGYTTQIQEISQNNADNVSFDLSVDNFRLSEVVVGASRIEETKLEAPVSVETMNARDIQNTAAASFFDEIHNLKGVQPNVGSILYSSINTRGFADPNNLRFVQLLDGASIVTPAFGNIGNTAGVSELDVSGVELIPGASSALYGADAFNGLLLIKTKDPFEDQGVSVVLKSGFTQQQRGTDPYSNVAIRVASELVEDKLAFKIDYETIQATDWQKVNPLDRVTNIDRQAEQEDYINNNPVNNPAFDYSDRYGEIDSRFSNVKLPNFPSNNVPANPAASDTTTVNQLNRTGVGENDILDPRIDHHKINAGLYYRPAGSDFEISYLYKWSISDYVVRITTTYPFYDMVQFQHQLKMKNSWFTARAYYNKNTAANAYASRFSGKTIQETLLSNNEWLDLYTRAFRGDIDGVSPNTHIEARRFADSFMPKPGSAEYESAKYLALNTFAKAGTQGRFSSQSGAKLFENSAYWHGDLSFDFSQFLNGALDLQAGGMYRQYILNSNGSFFNDGPLGFNEDIKYSQIGVFAQASKKFADRLKITLSGRYDKREELDGFFTPRASIVYSAGENKQHNFRASYQTGFRNPSPQEGYINYWVAPTAVVLGGLQRNIDNFTFEDRDGNILTAADAFAGVAGLDQSRVGKVSPEKNTVFEVGYKGVLFNSLYTDLSFVHTIYQDFIQTTVSPSSAAGGMAIIWYNNVEEKVSTNNFNAELEYRFPTGLTVGTNYSFIRLDASNYENANENNRAINLRFNTPEHRINTSISHDNLYAGIGFSVTHRWNAAYDYQSSFGSTRIESFNVVDATLSRKFDDTGLIMKLGGTNILGEKYTFVYGGPNIGSMFYLSLKYEDIGRLFNK